MNSPCQKVPALVSAVMVFRNRARDLEEAIRYTSEVLGATTSDFELIVVDNASEDDSATVLRHLTSNDGLPNLQVFVLTREVDDDVAAWAGLENSLGDFVVVFDPFLDDIGFLPTMLDAAAHGADVVFASNEIGTSHPFLYQMLRGGFLSLFKWIAGVHLAKDSPPFRLLSRHVVNFVLRHPAPSLTYRHIPATVGFEKVNLSYRAKPRWTAQKHLWDSIDRGMRILVSTSRLPLRLVTSLSLFGAISNLIYSIYVISIAFFKTDVAPGWVTLSLQQSGMFFLMSLVLLVIGEYLLHVASLSNETPPYHVAQEFTSPVKTWLQKLNIEDDKSQQQP